LPTTLFLSGLVDAVRAALAQWRRCIKLAWVDGGYAGKLVTWAQARLKPKLALQIVKRPDDLHTFQVLPRRWLVERTLAWITRSRRTVRDYERLTTPRDHHLPGHDHHHEPPPGPALPAAPGMSTTARPAQALPGR
jgi:transposase